MGGQSLRRNGLIKAYLEVDVDNYITIRELRFKYYNSFHAFSLRGGALLGE
jgi:hypothetical protein